MQCWAEGLPLGGDGGRGMSAGRENTVAPGYRGHPRRSDLGCAERGNPVEVRVLPGKPTARKAQLLLAAGQDGPTSKCRQAERPQEAGAGGCFLLRPPRRNWPDTGSCPARKGADADQVSHWSF
jgi:hypothetical protein